VVLKEQEMLTASLLLYHLPPKKKSVKIIEIGEKIVYGKKEDIEAHHAQAERSKHINTDYVESRIRKTLCFSKKLFFMMP
jgi:hypothetical protein